LILIPVLYHLFESNREKRRLRRLANHREEQPQLLTVERAAEQEAEREVIRG
jgi:hypothetical protein